MTKYEAIQKLIEILVEKEILSSKEACLLRLSLNSGLDGDPLYPRPRRPH